MKQLMDNNDYEKYLSNQWKDVDRIYELKLFSKHADMLEKLVQSSPDISKESKILCIGARYGIEMKVFQEFGFVHDNIIGIDIYPRDENIIKADMHNLPFELQTFDIIYSHHSIDHSLFPKKAFEEFNRVSKENAHWVFSIPFDDFGKEEAIDFDSSDEIKELILQFKHLVKYELEVKRNSNGFVEPSSTWLPEKWKHELRIIAI